MKITNFYPVNCELIGEKVGAGARMDVYIRARHYEERGC
jgi:hypothetical protein